MIPLRASLIVSTWNGRHLLETCLPRLQRAVAQAGGHHEIVVVDDASTDGTAEYVAREFPDVKLLALPRNLRFAGANNAAARFATGDLLVFLNNDMLVEPDFLGPLLQPFSDPAVFAVTAHLQMEPRLVNGATVRETGLVRGRFEYGFLTLRHEDPISEDPSPVIYAGGGSSAWRKDRFLELGGFDTLFRPFYFEDLDISYRGQKHGWRLLFSPLSRMEHKHRQTNNPTHFPAGYVERMFRKNTLLFHWKVLTDGPMLSAHFRSLWRMLLRPGTHPGLTKAFVRAAMQLPELLSHRRRDRVGNTLTDAEVIARAAGRPHTAVTDAGFLPYRSIGVGRRILILGSGPLPFESARRVTASGHRTWHIAQALRQDGHQLVIAGARVPGAYEDEATRPPILRYTGGHITYYSMHPDAFENSDLLARICEEWEPDAIVAVNSHCASVASRLPTDVPLWADLNGYGMAEAQARASSSQNDTAIAEAWGWEQRALARADAISVVSVRQKYAAVGELAALGRLSGRNYGDDLVHHLPNAIEAVPYKHQKQVLRGSVVCDDAFVVLWSGGYGAGTDVETLFAGLTAAMREEPRLVFVSLGGAVPGQEEQSLYRLREMVEASEFADRFHFLGWVPTEDLPDYYLESDLGLNVDRPSYEMLLGCRYRLLDMLRAGLPVVTSLGPELSHTVRAERLGLAFTPGSAEGLTQALLELARDASLRRRCSSRAKEWAFKHRPFDQVLAPLRRWAVAPRRVAPPVVEASTNHVWRPRTAVGRFAQTWETAGTVGAVRQAVRATFSGLTRAAAKALWLRRGTAPWGLEAVGAPTQVAVIRAGTLALTREVVQHLRAQFPEAQIAVIAPEAVAEETRYEVEAEVIAVSGTDGVGYRPTRSQVRALRGRRFDAVLIAGEGNRRAESLALALRGARVEVRDDGAAHTLAVAPYKPLLLLPLLVWAGLRGLGITLLVGIVWGGLRLEGLAWRWRRPAGA